MLFLLSHGNDKANSRFPAVTYALMFVNIAVYLWMLPFDREAMLHAMGLIPDQPSLNGILTSMFLHCDILHLAWNMLFLWLVGPNVEYALGRLEYAIFYFGSGFAAAVLYVVVSHAFIPAAADVPMVGASGAIAGILGIFVIRFYKTRLKIWYFVLFLMFIGWGRYTIPAWIILIPLVILARRGQYTIAALIILAIWFIQQLVGGMIGIIDPQSGGVAYWAHIGGMLFGMILAYALRMGLEGTKEYLMTDAKTNLEQGTTWGAAENLRTLLEHDPENADVHAELANTYVMQHDRKHAISHYQQCIDLLLRKDDREKAVVRFAELKHHYRDARLDLKSEFQLARYMIDAGYHTPALQLMQDIISTHPGTPEGEVALMKSGDLYLKTFGDFQNALECYEQFLVQYPHSTYRVMVEKSIAQTREKL